MSTKIKHTSSTSSFESPYVSLDLLAYLNSGQKTPFHIFNDVVMPEFLFHLSKGKQFLPAQEMDEARDIISRSISMITIDNDEEDNSNSNCNDLHAIFEDIQNDLNYIKKACRKLKQWEELVNKVIQQLILQGLDDAFKERTGELDDSTRTNFIQDKLKRTKKVVSMLKDQICSPPQFSLVSLDSESFQRSSFSMRYHSLFRLPVQLPDVNTNEMIANRYTSNEIEMVYNGLDVTKKLCLLCLSVFPENATIKKKVLVHWWVGEGFIDSLNNGDNTAESIGNEYFKEFVSKGIIELVHKKRRQSSDNCKMHPSIRYAIILLAKRAGFVSFNSKGNPTAEFSSCRRACLVKTEEGSSLRDLTYSFHLKQEKIQTLFNVNEPHLNFRLEWFSKMKYVRVLQLGRWRASAKQLVEVEDTEFLKGLKKMKQLRYFSLRGISRITELPNSICKLSNLRILNLNGCDNLEKLPDGIGSLTNLTHLDMSECYLISHMPKGLALLSELQVLKGFVIGKPRPGGLYCGLADLAKLEHLRKLSIHVDRTCPQAEEELNSLPKFKNLRSLSVAWSRIYNASTFTKVPAFQRLMSREKSMRTPPMTPPSQPAALNKLGLQYFHGSKMPDWLKLLNLKSLKKLYIRGGELSDLHQLGDGSWTVKHLRLKFLSELRMDWRELQALFPNLTYVEKFNCPKLSFFPCDENGEWISSAADTN
jgi:hypothetical protein